MWWRSFLGIWFLLGCSCCFEIWGCHLCEKLLRRLFDNEGLDWKRVKIAANVESRDCYQKTQPSTAAWVRAWTVASWSHVKMPSSFSFISWSLSFSFMFLLLEEQNKFQDLHSRPDMDGKITLHDELTTGQVGSRSRNNKSESLQTMN